MNEENIKVMQGLPDDAFLLEKKNMENEVSAREKKIEHTERILEKTRKYYDLTKKVQEEIRKHNRRIEPVFEFEKSEDWQEANLALTEHQHNNELTKISDEIERLEGAVEATNKEINLQKEALVEFEKEKTKRGI